MLWGCYVSSVGVYLSYVGGGVSDCEVNSEKKISIIENETCTTNSAHSAAKNTIVTISQHTWDHREWYTERKLYLNCLRIIIVNNTF